jgi:hypothetical protein
VDAFDKQFDFACHLPRLPDKHRVSACTFRECKRKAIVK